MKYSHWFQNKTPNLILAVMAAVLGCSNSNSPNKAVPDSNLGVKATDKTPSLKSNASSTTNETSASSVSSQIADEAVSQRETLGVVVNNTLPPRDSAELRVEALQSVEQLVEKFPQSPDALEIKARMYLLLGENEIAKQTWTQSLRLAPEYAYAMHGLGRIAMREGDHRGAIEYFKKAIPGQPENPEPAQDLADAFSKTGQIDEAIQTLLISAKAIPNSTQTHLQLGQAYLAKREFLDAKNAFEKALAITPNVSRAQQGLGTALMRLGEREEAAKLLEAQHAQRTNKNRTAEEVFVDEKKDISKRFELISKIYLDHGKNAQAERLLSRAIALDPTNSKACILLLDLYRTLQRQQDAISTAALLCKMEPNNPSCHFTYGKLLQQAGQFDKAIDHFGQVIQLSPEQPEGYDASIQILLVSRKSPELILRYALKLVALRGNAADQELLGQAYAIHGDLQQAKTQLQKAIELDPTNANYKVAMQQLMRALGASNE